MLVLKVFSSRCHSVTFADGGRPQRLLTLRRGSLCASHYLTRSHSLSLSAGEPQGRSLLRGMSCHVDSTGEVLDVAVAGVHMAS